MSGVTSIEACAMLCKARNDCSLFFLNSNYQCYFEYMQVNDPFCVRETVKASSTDQYALFDSDAVLDGKNPCGSGAVQGAVCAAHCNSDGIRFATLSGSQRVECGGDGQWKGTLLKCTLRPTCEMLSPENGTVISNVSAVLINAGKWCAHGQENQGRMSLQACAEICAEHDGCTYFNHFQDGLCQTTLAFSASCPIGLNSQSTAKFYGVQILSSKSLPAAGATCRQSCLPGYVRLSGSFDRDCQTNGEWTGSKLICVPEKKCNASLILTNTISFANSNKGYSYFC